MRDETELTPEEARSDHWEMLRFLGLNAGFGMALGSLVAFALVWFDLGEIGTRLARSATPTLSFAMMAVPLALTFGACVTASAVMLMPYKRKRER